jgi:hypothetical protein
MAETQAVDTELRDRLYSAAHYEHVPVYQLHMLMEARAKAARKCLGDSHNLNEKQMFECKSILTHYDNQIKLLLKLK